MSSVNGKEGVLNYLGAVGGVGGSGSGTARASAGGNATSWFEAMSKAWGERLDQQANEIIELSNSLGQGADNPSQIAILTASSQRMAFLAQSAATSQNSASQALETIAKRN